MRTPTRPWRPPAPCGPAPGPGGTRPWRHGSLGCDGAASLPEVLRSFGSGAVFGEVWGDGPVRVVALHGWRRSHLDFAGVLGPGADRTGFSTLALDLPGFGATPPPGEPYGSLGYAEVVARAIADVSEPGAEGRMVVLGHSLGARVAVGLAHGHPEMVAGLVLTGAPLVRAPGRAPRPKAAFRAVRFLHRAGLVGEERMERARKRHGSDDYRAADGVVREILVRLLAERYESWIEGLGCPVDLVWGSADATSPVPVAEAITHLARSASLEVIQGVGHLVPTEAPRELREAVLRMLEATGS